jgi:uncharacterized membrane protein (GlpM family)
MSPETAFLSALILKMAATAAVVVTASIIAERVGPLIGALVATLPIAAGPAYILLSLDHDTQFLADSTVASLAVHAATGVFGTAYVFAAQRWSFPVTIAVAVGAWLACALVIRSIEWSLIGAIVLSAATYGACVPLVQRFLHVRVPAVARRWFDIPLRAALVATLVGAVVAAGANVGPKLTGILAVFPIVMLSLMLILHPRIGGKATAAIIANTMWGLVGFAMSILALHLTVVPLGAPLGLAAALVVSVAVNVTIFLVRRRGHAAKMAERQTCPTASPPRV